MNLKFFSFMCFLTVFGYSEACGGYKLRIDRLENCVANPVIAIHTNGTLKVSKKCMITPYGCADVKGFKTSEVTYTLSKNGMPLFNGKIDTCKEMDNMRDEVKAVFDLFNIPTKCPIPTGQICPDTTKTLSIEPFKQYISMAVGKSTVRVEAEHDNGKSCIEAEFEIYK